MYPESRRETEFLNDPEFLREAIWLARYVAARDPYPDAEAEAEPRAAKDPPPDGSATTTRPPVGGEERQAPEKADEETGGVHPKAPAGPGQASHPAAPVYVPATGALPQPLELTRALRPFQRRLRSRLPGGLDEMRTAELSAECLAVTPVFQPARERWFSLTLLVDDAPAMAPWRKTAAELARLLGGLGLFRDVRSYTFDRGPKLFRGGVETAPGQLADPSGRTLVVVLTNGVGRHWQSRILAGWLRDWAQATPVAICSLLPEASRRHTHLGPAYLWARAPVPGAPNGLLISGEGSRPRKPAGGATVFPVFSLDAPGLARWAAMQMAVRSGEADALAMDPDWFDETPGEEAGAAAAPIGRRVAAFWSMATPDAALLLGYLAAVPLQLPIMRLVQQAMFPESSRLSALSEVLMSGLIERWAPARQAGGEDDPEEVLFDFVAGAREHLRDRLAMVDLDRIWGQVRAELRALVERKVGKTIDDFEAWVMDPRGTKKMSREVQEFVRVTMETMRALGYRAVEPGPLPPSIVRPPQVAAVPVYISHSRLDSGWVERVEKALGVLGEEGLIRVERRENLARGAKEAKEEAWLAGLRAAKVVVVLVSKHSNESDYCRLREGPVIAEFEKDRGRRVVRVQWDAQKARMDKRLGRLAEEVREAAHGLNAGTQWVNPADGLTYVWCPPGRFRMGASEGDEEAYGDEKPAREVAIEKGFWIGETAVTQRAYERVMGKNPSYYKGSDRPVERVRWHDAVAYAEKVGMRLPTEAEWEYAARAGSKEARYGPVDEIAWYDENSGDQTHEVGKKKANGWGLHDMLGNVWEWTDGWYDSSQSARPLRGGSYYVSARNARVSCRDWDQPDVQIRNIGFRCVGESASL